LSFQGVIRCVIAGLSWVSRSRQQLDEFIELLIGEIGAPDTGKPAYGGAARRH
jgi:hypothetical protein